jgi:hypothetical protein
MNQLLFLRYKSTIISIYPRKECDTLSQLLCVCMYTTHASSCLHNIAILGLVNLVDKEKSLTTAAELMRERRAVTARGVDIAC